MQQLLSSFKVGLVVLIVFVQPLTYAETIRIAFGSCYSQNTPSEEIWRVIAAKDPSLTILMGDNLYIDSADPKKFAKDYASLANNKGFQELLTQSDMLATWDDHDYGLQDGGKEFSAKQLAKEYFVDFFDYSELKNIAPAEGIQHSRTITVGDKTVRIILLDTRWYRDKLSLSNQAEELRMRFQLGAYVPHTDESTTLLGAKQWQWLEETLAKPVDLNIIVSSIQFLAEYTGWEIWANFPHERRKMLNLLNRYSYKKAVIISGDVHRAETSMMTVNDWELYDVTASGLSANVYPAKPNVHRLGDSHIIHNFGMFHLESTDAGLNVKSVLYDAQGKELSTHVIPIDN